MGVSFQGFPRSCISCLWLRAALVAELESCKNLERNCLFGQRTRKRDPCKPESTRGKAQNFFLPPSHALRIALLHSSVVVAPKQIKFQEKHHFSGKKNWAKRPRSSEEYGGNLLIFYFFFPAILPQRQPWWCGTIRQQQGPGKGTPGNQKGMGDYVQREKKSLTMDMNQHMSRADLGVGHVWTDPKLHSKSFETEATLELLLPTVRQNLQS